MAPTRSPLRPLLLACCLFPISLAAPSALAGLSVTGLELIDRTRVDRTTFDYTYRVTVTNTAPVRLDEVTTTLDSKPRGF